MVKEDYLAFVLSGTIQGNERKNFTRTTTITKVHWVPTLYSSWDYTPKFLEVYNTHDEKQSIETVYLDYFIQLIEKYGKGRKKVELDSEFYKNVMDVIVETKVEIIWDFRPSFHWDPWTLRCFGKGKVELFQKLEHLFHIDGQS